MSLMKFLIENDLLVDINPFNQDGSVKKCSSTQGKMI